jgi:hypothetical protein
LLRLEYISLVAIALIIINWGFIPGILVGIMIGGCAARVPLSGIRFSAGNRN